jgi:hypothetical protein
MLMKVMATSGRRHERSQKDRARRSRSTSTRLHRNAYGRLARRYRKLSRAIVSGSGLKSNTSTETQPL